MRWQLIGFNSEKTYYESNTKEDVHQWIKKEYPFGAREKSRGKGRIATVKFNLPEPLKIIRKSDLNNVIKNNEKRN